MRSSPSPSRLASVRHRVNDLNNRDRRRRLWIFLFKSVHKPGRCYWCERPLTFEYSTFDHNPPLCFPNSNPDCGVISCECCNGNHANKRNGYPPIPDYLTAMKQEEIERAYLYKTTKKFSRHDENKSITRAWEKQIYG